MIRLRLILAIVLLFSSLTTPVAQGDTLGACRIKASDRQQLSLGFPFRSERLAKLPAPKILVIPFQLQETPDNIFFNLKQDYEKAADYINEFSNGKSKPQFIYSPVIKTEITKTDIKNLRANQNVGNQTRNESISTWGFIRSFVSKYDSNLDFTGIDGVILNGSAPDRGIAEAMTYLRNNDPYFRPLQTNEGEVLNAVLMDSNFGANTIAHEVMHLYGLTDLYGSNTGPGQLSLMASSEPNLLSYEKWVLGWLPDSEVTCISNLSTSSITSFSFDYSKFDQLAVLRTPNEDPYIVETTKSVGKKYIAYYSLNNEGRPPIALYQERVNPQVGGVEIGDYRSIGLQLKSPNFTLLITNIEANKISISMAPTSQLNSAEFKELVTKATQVRSQFDIDAQTKSEADLKAQQEAASKVTASKKKTTITCIKGKTVRKVTAVSPKCPSGFKRK